MARKITDQQRLFAANVASGMTLAKSAVAAGYSHISAGSQATQLLKNPKVAGEIARIEGNAVAVATGSKAECLDLIWQTMQGAAREGVRRDVYKGAELWLKATGQLIEKQEIRREDVDLSWGEVMVPGEWGDDEG